MWFLGATATRQFPLRPYTGLQGGGRTGRPRLPTPIRRDPWRRTKVRAGRRTLRPDVLRNSYRGSREALDSVSPVFGRGKLLTLRRLTRAGSPAAARPPAPDSLGPPRFEPSTRRSFRKKVDYSNLNRCSDRMPVYGAGLRKKPRVGRWSLRSTAPGNSHCTPTAGYNWKGRPPP